MYKALDILKFFCALLVVYIHTYCFEPNFGWIKTVLASVGVPFFFIVSGFFLGKGFSKNGPDKRSYLKNYLQRICIMYVAWTIVTLPIAFYNISMTHPTSSMWMKSLFIVRCFFFTGSLGIYWYVLSLLYNSIILYLAEIHKKIRIPLLITAILFFVVGVLYESRTIEGTLIGDIIHIVFGSERNFLNVGLLYMCVGYFLSQFNIFMGKKPMYWLSILVLIWLIQFFMVGFSPYKVLQLPASICLFLFGLSWKPSISDKTSLMIRKWSTIIYLSHFPFILLFDYYLRRGTYIDYPCTILFCIVFYHVINAILPKSFVQKLFGN